MRVVIFKAAAYFSKSMSYNVEKVDFEHVFPCMVANIPNIAADASYAILQTFATFAYRSKRTQKCLIHLAINPAKNELKDLKKIIKFTLELLSRMGYGRQPLVIYYHHDTQRPHFHAVSLRVDANGNGVRVYDDVQRAPILASRHEHRRCYRICTSLCQKYGYTFDGVDTALERQDYEVFDYNKGNIWRQYDTIAEKVMLQYSFTSLDQYLDILLTKGVVAREYEMPLKNNKTGEVCTQMRIVCDTYDANGKKRAKCHFLPLSLVSAVDDKVMSCQPTEDAYHEVICGFAWAALRAACNVDSFKAMLLEGAITPVFNTIDGEIDSITFVDDDARCCVDIRNAEFIQDLVQKKKKRCAVAMGANESFNTAKKHLLAYRSRPVQTENKSEKSTQKPVKKTGIKM